MNAEKNSTAKSCQKSTEIDAKAMQFSEVMPEIDSDIWQPAYDPEDHLLAMLDENALGEYMGPESFPTRKAELLAKKKQGIQPKLAKSTTCGNLSRAKSSKKSPKSPPTSPPCTFWKWHSRDEESSSKLPAS